MKYLIENNHFDIIEKINLNLFENYTSEYLFYFFDIKKKKHIYSINYKNHLKKLNEYRSKQ